MPCTFAVSRLEVATAGLPGCGPTKQVREDLSGDAWLGGQEAICNQLRPSASVSRVSGPRLHDAGPPTLKPYKYVTITFHSCNLLLMGLPQTLPHNAKHPGAQPQKSLVCRKVRYQQGNGAPVTLFARCLSCARPLPSHLAAS